MSFFKEGPEVISDSRIRRPKNECINHFLSEIWALLTPKMINRLKEMLVVEFGMSAAEAEMTIMQQRDKCVKQTTHQKGVKHNKMCHCSACKSCTCYKCKSSSMSIIKHGDVYSSHTESGCCHKWVNKYSSIDSGQFTDHLVSHLRSRKNSKVRKLADKILGQLCDIAGERCSLMNPRTKMQRILVFAADQLATLMTENLHRSKKDLEDCKCERGRECIYRFEDSLPTKMLHQPESKLGKPDDAKSSSIENAKKDACKCEMNKDGKVDDSQSCLCLQNSSDTKISDQTDSKLLAPADDAIPSGGHDKKIHDACKCNMNREGLVTKNQPDSKFLSSAYEATPSGIALNGAMKDPDSCKCKMNKMIRECMCRVNDRLTTKMADQSNSKLLRPADDAIQCRIGMYCAKHDPGACKCKTRKMIKEYRLDDSQPSGIELQCTKNACNCVSREYIRKFENGLCSKVRHQSDSGWYKPSDDIKACGIPLHYTKRDHDVCHGLSHGCHEKYIRSKPCCCEAHRYPKFVICGNIDKPLDTPHGKVSKETQTSFKTGRIFLTPRFLAQASTEREKDALPLLLELVHEIVHDTSENNKRSSLNEQKELKNESPVKIVEPQSLLPSNVSPKKSTPKEELKIELNDETIKQPPEVPSIVTQKSSMTSVTKSLEYIPEAKYIDDSVKRNSGQGVKEEDFEIAPDVKDKSPPKLSTPLSGPRKSSPIAKHDFPLETISEFPEQSSNIEDMDKVMSLTDRGPSREKEAHPQLDVTTQDEIKTIQDEIKSPQKEGPVDGSIKLVFDTKTKKLSAELVLNNGNHTSKHDINRFSLEIPMGQIDEQSNERAKFESQPDAKEEPTISTDDLNDNSKERIHQETVHEFINDEGEQFILKESAAAYVEGTSGKVPKYKNRYSIGTSRRSLGIQTGPKPGEMKIEESDETGEVDEENAVVEESELFEEFEVDEKGKMAETSWIEKWFK